MHLMQPAAGKALAADRRLQQRVVALNALAVVEHIAAAGVPEVQRIEWRGADAAPPRAERVRHAGRVEQTRAVINHAAGGGTSVEHNALERRRKCGKGKTGKAR